MNDCICSGVYCPLVAAATIIPICFSGGKSFKSALRVSKSPVFISTWISIAKVASLVNSLIYWSKSAPFSTLVA